MVSVVSGEPQVSETLVLILTFRIVRILCVKENDK